MLGRTIKKTESNDEYCVFQNQGQALAYQIKTLILAREFKPNEWIREESLTQRFKVSRTPIREAFIILENEGFIRSIPYKGKQVNEISSRTIYEYYLIMSVLEELAVRTAGPLITCDEFVELEDIFETIDQLTKTGQVHYLQVFHRRFHNFFIEKSDVNKLKQLLLEQYSLFTKRTQIPARVDETPVKEYRLILEALQARDYELAGKRMRYHILEGCAAQIERLESEIKLRKKGKDVVSEKGDGLR